MMMKIFGAALIVSGGYLIGKVRTVQYARRLKRLNEIREIFEEYDKDLRQYRRSLSECAKEKGGLAEEILEGKNIKNLTQEDLTRLSAAVAQLRSGTYHESMEISKELLGYLKSTIAKLQEDAASQGKALPLLTGAIGLLIAVLLF